MRKLFLLIGIFFLISVFNENAYAQVSKVKKTIRGEAMLIRPISNKAFSKIFSGVFAGNLSLNFGVKNFNTGFFYNMMQSQIFPKFFYEPHSIQTVHTVGLRFSYDVYPPKAVLASTKGNFFMFSPYLSAGLSQVVYSRLKCVNQDISGAITQTYSFSAGANFNLMFSEYDGVGFTLGYSFLNHEFNPDKLCLTYWFPNVSESDKKGLSQYILFGFNAHFDLAKRDNDSD